MLSKFNTEKLIKTFGVIMVLGFTFTGCSINSKTNTNYKELALQTLEERYNEDFDIKQTGGTFGALNDTKKLVCYPVNNPNKFFFVEVEKDLSEVYDNYINRIMEDKLNEMLTPIAKEIFEEEVKIQSFFDDQYNIYDSLNMGVVDFMNRNDRCSYILDIFIDGGENLDKLKEVEKINLFAEKLLENNISNRNSVNIWYLKEGEFSKVKDKYYDLNFNGEYVEYYLKEDKIYNTSGFKIKDKKMNNTKEEIINSFKY